MLTVGIDAGSRAIKVVLLDADTGEMVASGIEEQGVRNAELTERLFDRLLSDNGCSRGDVRGLVATGYGRNTIAFADRTVTEITCHAVGVRRVSPAARTVVEIGGQDSKLLRLGVDGQVYDFSMNDRCAAGTGRFLEIVAQRLEVDLASLGSMAATSLSPAAISSTCAVFAETEIIGLLASGMPARDVAAGVLASVATRIGAMMGRNITPPVVFTGGVALVPGMDCVLSGSLGCPVTVAPNPQMTGALGAALIAMTKG